LPAIGIRSTPNEIFYVIVDGTVDNPTLTVHSKLRQPSAYELPKALSWYREKILAITEEFGIQACGIRTTEPISRTMGASAREGATIRAHIEGVAAEAAASIGLNVVIGPLATITAFLDSKNAKKYLSNDEFRGIDQWSDLNTYYKEAILAGVAALRTLEE